MSRPPTFDEAADLTGRPLTLEDLENARELLLEELRKPREGAPPYELPIDVVLMAIRRGYERRWREERGPPRVRISWQGEKFEIDLRPANRPDTAQADAHDLLENSIRATWRGIEEELRSQAAHERGIENTEAAAFREGAADAYEQAADTVVKWFERWERGE